ncbi:sigma-54-dependent Fis family transcriptional regulator [Effusibacillus lacus]|uniref:Sigma-54-dependent Fis family transcriptional regulator n=1 Tax=Effusibacillus lacus TaxID=1348429 RepID=A0A292YTA8_9BACL|nr:PAS domain S-box-containing protein [Effusibacillus lacus]GAX91715.1 sigma-54-dependent Fis family transcriptional regulator [Effusibacillus lacus]
MRNKEQLKAMWEKFVSNRQLDPDLDELVRQSWLRSVAFGVDPFQPVGRKARIQTSFPEYLQRKRGLLETALPLMESLYKIVRGSGFLVILCCESGFLLKVIGDRDTLREAERIHFVEGADWSEEAVGTNAIGTCLKLDRPIQIYAAEHFSEICHAWTCSAAPVHSPDGRIIGVLNMSGPFEKVHPHTLGMVVSAVEAIENHLSVIEKSRKNEIMQSYLEATVNTLTEGVVIAAKDGKIIRTNDTLSRIVKLKPEQMEGQRIDQVFDNRVMSQITSNAVTLTHREIRLRIAANGETVPVLMNVKPIKNPDGESMGALITLQEIEKVRQFVYDMTGSRAKITFDDIVGQSAVFLDCVNEARLAARTDSNVLLTGESGTGKDLFAQAIHNASIRRGKPFLAINCGAIPRDLLGSELFGFVEEAFTGAKKGGNAGKFELADGGTLFLDEIGEMSLEMQVLLLRVLQNKEVMRIGGYKAIPVDVRIIASTNKNLEEEVRKGTFREDLFYRLNVIPIKIPGLRKRKEDIPLLVYSFTEKLNQRLQKRIRSVSSELLDILSRYDWPGNVRELQNVLERTIIRADGEELLPEFLPIELRLNPRVIELANQLPFKEEIKKQALIRSIHESKGNYKQAARQLGIARSTLYRLLKKYNLK